jgi:predicted TPR repeat methyltransferase/thioredoxin-like negative regulator of GroEL
MQKKANTRCNDKNTPLNKEYQKLQQTLLEDNTNLPVLHKIIFLSLQLQYFNNTEEYIALAKKINPTNELTQLYEALYYFHTKRNESAMEHLLKIVNKNPNQIQALMLLAQIHFQKKQYQESIDTYKKVIKVNGTIDDAYYNCALCYCYLNQIDNAIVYLEKTLSLKKDHVGALSQLGQIQAAKENYLQAADLFSQRLIADNTHAETWHSLGQCEFLLDKFSDSIVSLQHCIDLKPHHNEAHQDLAHAYLRNNQLDKAIKHYHLQLEVLPNIETWYNLGVCFMFQEKKAEAETYFNTVIKKEPQHLQAHINLAALYLAHQNIKKSIQFYQKALLIEPNNSEIKYIIDALSGSKTPLRAPDSFVTSLFDQYAFHYDQHLTQHLNYQAHQQLFDLVKSDEWAHHSLKITDLGCGTGLCGDLFKTWAKHLIGIDLSSKMLSVAKQRNIYDQVLQGDIVKTLPSIEKQDLLIAADVFSYLGDLSHVLKTCFHTLLPGGTLAFSVESTHESNDYILQKTIRYAHRYDYIKSCLENSGFKHITIHTVNLRTQLKKPVSGYVCIAHKT